jgi:hypothetical protein
VLPGENPTVGLILCAEKDHAMAKYALEGLSNTARALPDSSSIVSTVSVFNRAKEATGIRQASRGF